MHNDLCNVAFCCKWEQTPREGRLLFKKHCFLFLPGFSAFAPTSRIDSDAECFKSPSSVIQWFVLKRVMSVIHSFISLSPGCDWNRAIIPAEDGLQPDWRSKECSSLISLWSNFLNTSNFFGASGEWAWAQRPCSSQEHKKQDYTALEQVRTAACKCIMDCFVHHGEGKQANNLICPSGEL